ncbi:hypothetical protein PR048_009925 [Dryococelus australis]|uniref:Uncharacterized protein n=1 Tax=Dryococelus australis TaxID=614101 RepID=A0ABQ9I1A0_9NEOP|nr:hypothetical protein PR048_009925 [Dryococelus australis]
MAIGCNRLVNEVGWWIRLRLLESCMLLCVSLMKGNLTPTCTFIPSPGRHMARKKRLGTDYATTRSAETSREGCCQEISHPAGNTSTAGEVGHCIGGVISGAVIWKVLSLREPVTGGVADRSASLMASEGGPTTMQRPAIVESGMTVVDGAGCGHRGYFRKAAGAGVAVEPGSGCWWLVVEPWTLGELVDQCCWRADELWQGRFDASLHSPCFGFVAVQGVRVLQDSRHGGNIKIKALQSTMDNTVAVQRYFIVTGRGWLELSMLTEQERVLKSQPHSMQKVSDVYLAYLCNVVLADGRVRVWRKPNEAMDPGCQQGTVQAGGGSVMVWGVSTCLGLGPLVHVPTKLNGNCCKTLLDNHLQPFIDLSFADNNGMFQQDNVLPHWAMDIQDLFEDHSGEFQLMECPARSPDMKPIEPLWDIVERAIHTQDPAPRNTRELWAAIQTAWLNISPGKKERAVCTSQHEGRKVMRGTFPMHVDQLFTLFFTSSKFYLDFHNVRRTSAEHRGMEFEQELKSPNAQPPGTGFRSTLYLDTDANTKGCSLNQILVYGVTFNKKHTRPRLALEGVRPMLGFETLRRVNLWCEGLWGLEDTDLNEYLEYKRYLRICRFGSSPLLHRCYCRGRLWNSRQLRLRLSGALTAESDMYWSGRDSDVFRREDYVAMTLGLPGQSRVKEMVGWHRRCLISMTTRGTAEDVLQGKMASRRAQEPYTLTTKDDVRLGYCRCIQLRPFSLFRSGYVTLAHNLKQLLRVLQGVRGDAWPCLQGVELVTSCAWTSGCLILPLRSVPGVQNFQPKDARVGHDPLGLGCVSGCAKFKLVRSSTGECADVNNFGVWKGNGMTVFCVGSCAIKIHEHGVEVY